MSGSFQCDGESEFKRHVEAWSSRGLAIKLDARKIVDGVLRLADQGENAVEASLAEGYFESGAGRKSVGADGGNIDLS
jgi:hypothetical protein